MKFWPFTQAKEAISPGQVLLKSCRRASSLKTSTAHSRGELSLLYPTITRKYESILSEQTLGQMLLTRSTSDLRQTSWEVHRCRRLEPYNAHSWLWRAPHINEDLESICLLREGLLLYMCKRGLWLWWGCGSGNLRRTAYERPLQATAFQSSFVTEGD